MLLSPVGTEGQQRLSSAHALVVGCGALGCVTASLLARAGVGRLTLVDRDLVETTNLQRQILYTERHVRDHTPKAHAAAQVLRQANSSVTIEPVVASADCTNAPRLAGIDTCERPRADIILDGTDNFEARYLLNDLAVRESIPFLYAGAVSARAMGMTILPQTTACLRCLFPDPPPPGSTETCDTVGVWGPAVTLAGAIQASEALKLLLGHPGARSPALVDIDMWTNTFRPLDITAQRRDDCPCCAHRDFPFLEGRISSHVQTVCGRDAHQISPQTPADLDLSALAARLKPAGDFTATPFLVQGVLSNELGSADKPIELTIFPDGRTIVAHAIDADHARSIVARTLGL